MKKLLLICGFLLLLSGCTGSEDIAWGPEETSPDGIEVDHGEVLGQVIFADETSVEFTADFKIYDSQAEADAAPEIQRNTYPFSEDVVIKVIKEGKLVEITPDHAMEISLSSNSDDYYFYFVLSDDEVLSMTQANMILEADLNSNDDLVYVTGVSEHDGKQFVLVDPIVMLGAPDCTNMHDSEETGLPECNPNGFLIQNTDLLDVSSYEVRSDGTFFLIDWANYTEFPPSQPMDFDEFKEYFMAHADYFKSAPFYLQMYEESSGLTFKSLVEKYIP